MPQPTSESGRQGTRRGRPRLKRISIFFIGLFLVVLLGVLSFITLYPLPEPVLYPAPNFFSDPELVEAWPIRINSSPSAGSDLLDSQVGSTGSLSSNEEEQEEILFPRALEDSQISEPLRERRQFINEQFSNLTDLIKQYGETKDRMSMSDASSCLEEIERTLELLHSELRKGDPGYGYDAYQYPREYEIGARFSDYKSDMGFWLHRARADMHARNGDSHIAAEIVRTKMSDFAREAYYLREMGLVHGVPRLVWRTGEEVWTEGVRGFLGKLRKNRKRGIPASPRETD